MVVWWRWVVVMEVVVGVGVGVVTVGGQCGVSETSVLRLRKPAKAVARAT